MKTAVFLFTFLSILSAAKPAAAQTEEQRKYSLPEMTASLERLFTVGDQIGEFSTKTHDTFDYSDLYLDTPDWAILKNNFSIRLRRRIYTDNGKRVTEYGFQMKSEMTKPGATRMEVEDDQLEIYKVGGRRLPEWMDVIFDNPDTSSPAVQEAVRQIQAWCFKKREAALAPFQEIRGHFGKPLTNLRPVLAGNASRVRSHVYVNGQVWAMEASIDSAKFRPLVPRSAGLPAVYSIFELEVENKYISPAQGTEYMNRFEQLLTAGHGLKPGLDSKYRQSAKVLFGITL